MIEFLIEQLANQFSEFWHFMRTNYDPVRDTIDIALVFFAVYWLLVLIKGTRAVQILAGLMALIAARLISELFQLMTLTWILDVFFSWGWVIIIVVFQADIRRALARVGRGFFPTAQRAAGIPHPRGDRPGLRRPSPRSGWGP